LYIQNKSYSRIYEISNKLLQNKNICQIRPCQNGGMCKSDGNSLFYCLCKMGYSGQNCEIKTICFNRPCKNEGICYSNNTSSYECNCINDFYGLNCEYYKSKQFQYSNILITKQLVDNLLNLTKFEYKTWELIYQATQDGFHSDDFHFYCDNQSSTFTLIKTSKSFIFGGYTNQTWNTCNDDNDYCYKNDSNAFLISLVNQLNKPLRFDISKAFKQDAIVCNKKWGVNFGYSDIYVASESNENFNSLSYLHSYYSFKGGGDYNRNLFAGGDNYFQTSEIETYVVY
jgi:hypothetical protein